MLNDNGLIPYFMLPSLGSGSTLRGYSSYRFRDRHSMLMNAEFRWIPARRSGYGAVLRRRESHEPARSTSISRLEKRCGNRSPPSRTS